VEVLVGDYPLDGTTYAAAILLSGNSSTTFDLGTGLVLVSTDNAVGARAPEVLPVPVTGTQLQYGRLVGIRQRTPPGTGAPVPGWLRPGTTLEYQGTFTQGIALPARTTFIYEDVGPDWARLHAAFTVAPEAGGSTVDSWAVSGGAGPFWYDPGALAGMTKGDALDEDPLLQMRTVVTEVAPWAQGEYVQILTEGPGTQLLFTYDRGTGVPLGYSLAQGMDVRTLSLVAMP
jgi:hypothetical protein